MASSPSDGSSSFSPLGSTRGGYAGILPYHSMPALLHLANSTASGSLGVECLHPSLDVSGKLCVSSSCTSSSSSVHVPGRTFQRSILTSDSGGTMLGGDSLASHSSQHVGRYSLVLSHHKRSLHGCFSRPCAQGSAISAFNPLAAQRCMFHKQGFSSPVCQAKAEQLKHLHQRSTSSVGRNGWVGVFKRVYQNTISVPKLADFLFYLFRVALAWHTIGVYHFAISVFLEPHHLHKVLNHPVISKLIHHFYLQHPPSQKCFDPWDVECLLCLLESWALASFTTFKLA